MTEELLEKSYWVVDILPDQVPEDSPGRYFAVEAYYLQPFRMAVIHRRFTDILLKLNCYYDFRISTPDGDTDVLNPDPDLLDAWINEEQKDLCILFPGEDALITLNHDDIYMTVYHPPEALLKRIGRLASAEGMFLRRPERSQEMKDRG